MHGARAPREARTGLPRLPPAEAPGVEYLVEASMGDHPVVYCARQRSLHVVIRLLKRLRGSQLGDHRLTVLLALVAVRVIDDTQQPARRRHCLAGASSTISYWCLLTKSSPLAR